jgi:hypothetical protein
MKIMKMKTLLALFCLIGNFLFAQKKADLIIKNINIITMNDDKVLEKQSIAIADGKIIQIGDFSTFSKDKNTKIIKGKGQFLMPGIAEMHAHLPEIQKIDTFLRCNVAAGVTHVRIMNSEMPQLPLLERLKKEPNTIAPSLHFSHLIEKNITFNEATFDSLMGDMKQKGIAFIKLFSLSNEATFDHLMASANKNKVIVCGHYPSGVNSSKVLRSGFRSIEHLGGYTRLKDSTELLKAIDLTRENQVFNCPTLDWDIVAANLHYPNDYKSRLIFQQAPTHFLSEWEKALQKDIERDTLANVLKFKNSYLPTFKFKQKLLKKMSEKNCLLLLGSDPGGNFQLAGFNTHQEMLVWSQCGIDNFSILKAATISPAKFFNEQNFWGTIEIGKNADMIILEKNPLLDIKNITTVKKTIIKGRVFDKKELLKTF